MSFDASAPQSETLDNSFWSVIREGLRGSQRDFTQGPIWVALVILAIPMILEMSMESLFAVVDIFFVAKLGADAVAIVGLTESVMALIYAVAFGLAIGATATVARRTGEKDMKGAASSAAHVIYLGIIVSILIDRKSTRLNSSHSQISYAVFCLKKKKKNKTKKKDEQ